MRVKELLKSMVIGIIIAGMMFGCGAPQLNTSANMEKSGNPIVSKAIGTPSVFGYANGNDSADISALNYDLLTEYNDWKTKYVTSNGAGGFLRVQRDAKSGNDTVSEGIGYGMLLAVYFDDRDTFDGLWQYAQTHTCTIETYNFNFIAESKLMHWKVDKDNENVSEFADYPIENNGDTNTKLKASVPHGHVFMNKTTNEIVIMKPIFDFSSNSAYNTAKNVYANDSNYKYMAQYTRDRESAATDADQDMAAALVMAYYRWQKNGGTSLSINYQQEATDLIQDILYYEIRNPESASAAPFVRAGNLWGEPAGWNPSYYAPAWYRLYVEFSSSADAAEWQALIDTMYVHMDKLDSANGSAGLFPDWCNTSGTNVIKANVSDRYYTDGTNDKIQMQSFNYYYDAVRTPWRMAIDYSWFGNTSAAKYLNETSNFFKGKVTTLVDGYSITGGDWKWEDRDGFNPGKGGALNTDNPHSVTFIAMNATASMVADDAQYRKDFFNEVKNNKETFGTGYSYYGDTLRLLSLLYLCGRFVNFTDSTSYVQPVMVTASETVINNNGETVYELTLPPAFNILYFRLDSLDGKTLSGVQISANGISYSSSGYSLDNQKITAAQKVILVLKTSEPRKIKIAYWGDGSSGTTTTPTTPTTGIILTASDKGKYQTITGEQTYLIPLKTGTVHIDEIKPYPSTFFKYSLDGGAAINTPYQWGGPITVSTDAGNDNYASLKIIGTGTFQVKLNWW